MTFGLFVAWCVALSWYDCCERRLPNWLTIPGAIVIVGAGTAIGQCRTVVVGALLLFGLYLVAHVLAPTSLGAGDVKAAIGLGGAAALASSQSWVVAAVLAPLITAVVGALLLRGRPVPHGPSMCAATVFGILWCT
ncbi:A24 family peptidase [Smaragdicoccus niigatensis]|uniref:A24 family peptidase n=1 Tax=Smaragdicoccus niigatensis TaxID=359359 RepID=UPI0003763C7B|nr:A24 family peptidase [Smaragdicoccus niigatensis]